jgi:hypothetical protein
MGTNRNKQDRTLTAVIIILSIAGILYFGMRAISDNVIKNQENPFEYNIDSFKKVDTSLLHYIQADQIDLNFKQVHGIAISKDDKIFVTGDDNITIFSSKKDILNTIPCGEAAHSVAVDEGGNFYLAMDNHIEVYQPEGIKHASWPIVSEKALFTSVVTTVENVFVADAGNLIVWKYDKSGNLLGRIGDKDETKEIPGFIIPSPFFDVAIDPDGFLWVANTGRHSLENYTYGGDFRTAWGFYSMQVDGFCGCCNPTNIAILENGNFVTSEKGIPRVKVYNRLGNLVSIVAEPAQFDEGTEGLDLAVDSFQRIFVLDPKRQSIRIFDKKDKLGGGKEA